MKQTRLGKTELMVSELGFGGIPIIPIEHKEAVSIVRHCFERGISFFDTANMYADSERKIGEALEDVRDKVVLATKTTDRTAEGAAKHIDLSLKLLKTDHLDIYQFHNMSSEKELDMILGQDGAYEAVEKAQKEGKIRFIGFSSHDLATAKKACQTNRFFTVQFPFNFIEHDPADELFKIAEDNDMGIIGMKPLGGGLLEKAVLCFKFLRQFPRVVPIPGISSIEEADELIDFYLNPQPLTDEDKQEIERLRSVIGTKFCHRCGYCMPCEQGVNITSVMSFRSAVARGMKLDVVKFMVGPAMESAEGCTECEECLDKCPYKLPIPELLKENLAAYRDYINQ